MKALIIDDDPTCRLALCSILAGQMELHQAPGGREAISLWRQHFSSRPFDVVFLDILMPEVDGHEVLTSIRDHEYAARVFGGDGVKVVMVSVRSGPSDVLKAFRAQCDGYLVKPASPESVIDQMKKLDLFL